MIGAGLTKIKNFTRNNLHFEHFIKQEKQEQPDCPLKKELKSGSLGYQIKPVKKVGAKRGRPRLIRNEVRLREATSHESKSSLIPLNNQIETRSRLLGINKKVDYAHQRKNSQEYGRRRSENSVDSSNDLIKVKNECRDEEINTFKKSNDPTTVNSNHLSSPSKD